MQILVFLKHKNHLSGKERDIFVSEECAFVCQDGRYRSWYPSNQIVKQFKYMNTEPMSFSDSFSPMESLDKVVITWLVSLHILL